MIKFDDQSRLLTANRRYDDARSQYEPPVDLSEFKQWGNVRRIHITDKCKNLEAIGNATSATSLYLWGNELKKLPVETYRLPLQMLTITNNPIQEIDLRPWASSLRDLDLVGLRSPSLTEVRGLEECAVLEKIRFVELRHLAVYPDFSRLAHLRRVTLECFRSWPTLEGLLKCPKLEYVWLRRFQVQDDSLTALRERAGIKFTLQP